MTVAQLVTELDPAVFEGLKTEDGELCTAEVTTPTGLEDVCAEEVLEKFGVTAHTATGRAFFDVPLQRLPQVLELRSVENVHVVIHMQRNFPFTKIREECFSVLYSLAEGPLWRKGVRAWQAVFGDLDTNPFAVDTPLTKAFQEPMPLLDLRLLKKGSPVALNLPEDIKLLREQQSASVTDTAPEEPRCSQPSNCLQRDGVSPATEINGGNCPSSMKVEEHSLPSSENSRLSEENNILGPLSSSSVSSDSSRLEGVVDALGNCGISTTDAATPTRKFNTEERSSSSNNDLNPSTGLGSTNSFMDGSCKASECHDGISNGSMDKKQTPEVVPEAVNLSAPGVGEKNSTRDGSSGPSFRVCCNRAGTEHVFGSPEAARQLGAAINDRFSWPVRLKGHLLEVILNITDDLVYISLGLTKEPLYRRNLVSFGPTNLRATLCYSLVHLARPLPGDLVLDHMCGGASIPVEGALCFPKCFHVGGEMNTKAVDRAATNLSHVEGLRGASLPAGLIKWDATKMPFRESCVDVVVSDLPFGKRSGSKVDNRTLYLSALQETARVVRPGTGRAVLLTHDRNSMMKNLALVRKFWRNPSTRTINIGGLYAGVFLLVRTAAKYTQAS